MKLIITIFRAEEKHQRLANFYLSEAVLIIYLKSARTRRCTPLNTTPCEPELNCTIEIANLWLAIFGATLNFLPTSDDFVWEIVEHRI